ncbi:hypothetical protein U1Q18_009978 [Sarracenia purpurea var. burkii]
MGSTNRLSALVGFDEDYIVSKIGSHTRAPSLSPNRTCELGQILRQKECKSSYENCKIYGGRGILEALKIYAQENPIKKTHLPLECKGEDDEEATAEVDNEDDENGDGDSSYGVDDTEFEDTFVDEDLVEISTEDAGKEKQGSASIDQVVEGMHPTRPVLKVFEKIPNPFSMAQIKVSVIKNEDGGPNRDVEGNDSSYSVDWVRVRREGIVVG